MTYKELYEKGYEILQNAGIEEAALDARLLLERLCGTNRNDLLVHGDKPIEETCETAYRNWIKKRSERIPLQHITGVQEFMGLEFTVNEKVLIPRQDTEILVEEVLKELQDGMRILDMCTGSGCILISLLHYSNYCEGVGVDISPEALLVAEENGKRLLGGNGGICGDKRNDNANDADGSGGFNGSRMSGAEVTFLQSNLFEKVDGKYEFIVSNPPYIRSNVIDSLMPEVREHEPRLALDGAEDGLFFYRRIVEEAPDYLVSGGKLYFEIGYDQADAVGHLMRERGFVEVCVVKDYAGLDRVVYGTYIAG